VGFKIINTMKKQRIIDTERAPISNEEILSQQKGFQQILNSVNPVKGFKSGGQGFPGSSLIIGGGIIAGVAGGIWLLTSLLQNEPKVADCNLPADTASVFQSPVPEMLQTEEFVINNERDTVLVSEKGSRITIPAHSFEDANGNPVEKPVKMQFREFHNPAEIYLSGIPMSYDSAGVNYTFESAGMFQLYAYRDSEKLKLRPDKFVDIDLVSNDKETANFYQFDETAKHWSYLRTEHRADLEKHKPLKQDDYTVMPQPLAEAGNQSDRDSAITEKIVPRRANTENYLFDFEVDTVKFPELSRYKTLLFEVDPLDKSFNPDYYDVSWSKVEMVALSDGMYQVYLSRYKTKVSFRAYPVLKENEYAMAMKKFNTQKRKEQEQLAMNKSKLAYAANYSVSLANGSINEFSVDRDIRIFDLGTYNCDRPIPEPDNPVFIQASLTDSSGSRLAYTDLYVANIRYNVLWSFPMNIRPQAYGSLSNMVWFKTRNNSIALIRNVSGQILGKRKPIACEVYPAEEAMIIIRRLFAEAG